MPLITATGVTVTHDESALLQNFNSVATTDADDNDLNLTLPTQFSTRLTTLLNATVPTEVLIGAALSGFNEDNSTGQNVVTLTPAPGSTITGLAFTNASGAPLSGVDSGKNTADGDNILLYTDTENNNILVGRAGGPTGAIVFAAYIQETLTGTAITGGKIWVTQYEAMEHTVTSNPDDPLDLTGLVFIGASQDTEFSLANAPSGQNLFLMFTKANPTIVNGRISDVTIIATGKDPANQSTGVNINTGDTINTSQAGGPTTFGTNSQMITEQEGIRFTFVTGARADVTIPNLDQNEADLESNIDFTGMFGARTADFDVVQLQSGKSAQVKVTASSTAVESGNIFIDGYTGDSTVPIVGVRVLDSVTNQVLETFSNGAEGGVSSTIGISITGGVASITGVKAGYSIEYTTTLEHNRVLVENGAALNASGNTHADFDIGGFRLLQVSTETAEVGSKMIFEDDGPSIVVADNGLPDALTVDETTLNLNASANFADNFSSTPSYGADGAGTVTSAFALSVKTGNPDSGLDDVATGNSVFLFLNSGVVEGREGTDATDAATGDIVFTVSVNATGTVTLDQQRAIVHPNTNNPDDSKTLDAADLIVLTRTDTITDQDGDQNTGSDFLNIGQALNFKDDGPSIVVADNGQPDALTVDETFLATNASASFADNFSNTPSYGADGAGTVTSGAYALSVKSSGVASGLVDTLTNQSVVLTVTAGGVVEGRTATSGLLVFTVSVDAAGLVTLDQQRAIVHTDPTNPDESKTLAAADLIALTHTDTITDKDGDQNTGSDFINIGQALNFKDDGPTIETAPVQDEDPTLGATSWTFSGAFAYSIGEDKRGPTYSSAAASDFSGLELSGSANDVAIVDPSVTWDSESAAAATFNVSFNYDHDRNPATDPELVEGTLVFDKVNDTYTFEMDALQVNQVVTLGEGTGYETYDIGGTSPSSGPSKVATGKLGEGFFIQITGLKSPLNAGGNTVVTEGELVSGAPDDVTLSSTALGVSGNTIHENEAATINFFETDPKGNLGATNFSYATDFFIKFDGYETESDDLVLVVSLVDADDPSVTTTRAIYVDQGDVYENDTNNADLVGTQYQDIILNDPADPNDPFLDNNDALLIVESNDYNIGGGNWVIKGIQILSNDAGLTGGAINLNRNVGDDGGSSTAGPTGNTIAEDTSTNPLKIIDAGFATTTTTAPTLDLTLDFKVVDADGDFTGVQTIDIENPVFGP